MSWTDERIDTLKTMWEAGQTASQIAEALGGVSRNAVIGKAHRLGLQSRPSPVKPNEPAAAPAPVPAAPEPEPAGPTAAQASVYIGGSASAMEGAIGSPNSKSYSPSCMGEGEDGIWSYGSFTVYTYRENGTETVEAVQ